MKGPASVAVILVVLLLLGHLASSASRGAAQEGVGPAALAPASGGQAAPAAGAQGAPAAGAPGAPCDYELAAPLSATMEVMGDLFAKMPERVKAGQRRDFLSLRRDSLFTAEVANLASRLKGRTGDKDWVAISNVMKTGALSMAEAAKSRDADGFTKAYEKVKESCGSCHDKYRD